MVACTVSQINICWCLVLIKTKLATLGSQLQLCSCTHSCGMLTNKPWSKVIVLYLKYFIFNLFHLLPISLETVLQTLNTNLFICLPIPTRKALFMTEVYLYFKWPCHHVLWLLCVYTQIEVGENQNAQLTSIFTTGVRGGGWHPTCVLWEVIP